MAKMRPGSGIPRAAIEKYLLTSPVLSAALIARGIEAQNYWRGLEPAIPTGRPLHGKKRTGRYKESIRVKTMRTVSRMKVRVYSRDPKAHWIEYGAAHMPEYAPMAKTRAHILAQPGCHAITPGESHSPGEHS